MLASALGRIVRARGLSLGCACGRIKTLDDFAQAQ
jgi:hypothetical protein